MQGTQAARVAVAAVALPPSFEYQAQSLEPVAYTDPSPEGP